MGSGPKARQGSRPISQQDPHFSLGLNCQNGVGELGVSRFALERIQPVGADQYSLEHVLKKTSARPRAGVIKVLKVSGGYQSQKRGLFPLFRPW